MDFELPLRSGGHAMVLASISAEMQKMVEIGKRAPSVLGRLPNGGAFLNTKSVRLWSGMDDGVAQEVRLACTSEGAFSFEPVIAGEVVSVPISHCQLHAVFDAQRVEIEGPSFRGVLAPRAESISFAFKGAKSIEFEMLRNQFQVLVRNIGPMTTRPVTSPHLD